jgi:hypothetical protein
MTFAETADELTEAREEIRRLTTEGKIYREALRNIRECDELGDAQIFALHALDAAQVGQCQHEIAGTIGKDDHRCMKCGLHLDDIPASGNQSRKP